MRKPNAKPSGTGSLGVPVCSGRFLPRPPIYVCWKDLRLQTKTKTRMDDSTTQQDSEVFSKGTICDIIVQDLWWVFKEDCGRPTQVAVWTCDYHHRCELAGVLSFRALTSFWAFLPKLRQCTSLERTTSLSSNVYYRMIYNQHSSGNMQ